MLRAFASIWTGMHAAKRWVIGLYAATVLLTLTVALWPDPWSKFALFVLWSVVGVVLVAFVTTRFAFTQIFGVDV